MAKSLGFENIAHLLGVQFLNKHLIFFHIIIAHENETLQPSDTFYFEVQFNLKKLSGMKIFLEFPVYILSSVKRRSSC